MKTKVLSILNSNRRDLFFVTSLLGIASILLIVFRFLLKDISVGLIFSVAAGWFGILGFWLKTSTPLADQSIRVTKTGKRPGFWRTLGLASAFFAFSVLVFYVPMAHAFWHGADDARLLETDTLSMISNFDYGYNRPLVPLGPILAAVLTPDHVDSFLWLAFFLRLATAAVIGAFVRETIKKRSTLVSIIAAILFMVNPSEPTRFLAIVMINYFISTLLIWASLWLLMRSYRSGSRWLLILSCLLLGIALLSADGGYPLALIGIPLIIVVESFKPRILLWLFAWIGTLSLLALRLLLYLLTTVNPYQLSTLAGHGSLLDGLVTQISPLFAYFSVPATSVINQYWVYGLISVFLIMPLLIIPSTKLKLSRHYILCIGLFFIAELLGFLLYVHFPYVLRTQFYSAPVQAALWSLLAVCIVSLLPDLVKRTVLFVGISGIVFLAVVNTMAAQDQIAQSGHRFEYFVKAFQEIHNIAPSIKPSSVVLMVDDGPDAMMGIVDYHFPDLARVALGVTGYRITRDELTSKEIILTDSGVIVNVPVINTSPQTYRYNQLIVFAVNYRDGSVNLLNKIPSRFLSPGVTVKNYNPLAQIDTSKVDSLHYMYYLPWMNPPTSRVDIYSADAPFSLQENWYPLENPGNSQFRWVNDNAEIVITAPIPHSSLLTFDLEPGPSLGGSGLRLSFELNQGPELSIIDYKPGIPMSIALPPGLVVGDMITLHVLGSKAVAVPNDPRTLNFRVFHISLSSAGSVRSQNAG